MFSTSSIDRGWPKNTEVLALFFDPIKLLLKLDGVKSFSYHILSLGILRLNYMGRDTVCLELHVRAQGKGRQNMSQLMHTRTMLQLSVFKSQNDHSSNR